MATEQDIMEAFAGESQANRKYAIFAEKAKEEGYAQVARLFRAASLAEEIHARRLLRVAGLIRTTEENLKGGIEGETHEFMEMYPEFIRRAQEEGRKDAEITFTHAMKAEEVHAGLYKEAVDAVSKGSDLPAGDVRLCPVCGNVALGTVPEKCPICGVPGISFLPVE
ncbi:MAG: rubrerythrin family protein [Methanocalculus sp. MSAO_Arc1]|uniref:rubrerythrin family protein n=1 Tax=Methanocalculus TaxID=71151 RepID=UPI000FED8B99|nr:MULTISPECIES: ferritin family protein [unclassified Methanocalculus]MCP1661464.1 rubrerythrin [Methanocalculus sp. AMF5]RQD79742.1 MAG: rubrerythrin family protein [Methanocalculus sp. MSAO_Arc1]